MELMRAKHAELFHFNVKIMTSCGPSEKGKMQDLNFQYKFFSRLEAKPSFIFFAINYK